LDSLWALWVVDSAFLDVELLQVWSLEANMSSISSWCNEFIALDLGVGLGVVLGVHVLKRLNCEWSRCLEDRIVRDWTSILSWSASVKENLVLKSNASWSICVNRSLITNWSVPGGLTIGEERLLVLKISVAHFVFLWCFK
jgi:hypothetical protein